MTLEQFRARVAAYLKRTGISPTTFGRDVLGDSAWVLRLMKGAEPKERTRNKVLAAIKAAKATERA